MPAGLRARARHSSHRRLAVALAGVGLLAAALAAPAAGAVSAGPGKGATGGRSAPSGQVARVCDRPTRPDVMSCFALRRMQAGTQRVVPGTLPSGYSPSSLRSAYKLSTAAQQGGRGQTVAVVDAYNDPTAAADLAKYRSTYHLPPCTVANGCFVRVNQRGLHRDYPADNRSWSGEISLDLDMVSAICPNCRILLVEADNARVDSLGQAVNTAVRLGAKFVSNSFGGREFSGESVADDYYWHHDGVVMTASTGDYGYGVSYPAASPYVTAVGGTSLYPASTPRGWRETAWSGAGSGCSTQEPRPGFQVSIDSACGRRAVADVSAVADPRTGVAVYQTYGGQGWMVYGGTSASAPIIASVYALAAAPAIGTTPASYPYLHANHLFDVASGSNGHCGGRVWCTAGSGWDGPTGLGTPNGVTAFKGTRWFTQVDTHLGPLESPGSVVTFDGTQYAFWKGANGDLMQAVKVGSTWASPTDVGIGPLASQPVVVPDSSGNLDAYWMGTDQSLQQAVMKNGVWTQPSLLAQGPLASAPAVAVANDGSQYLYWRGTDNRLWEAHWTGGTLVGPTNLGFGPLNSAPTAAVDPAGHRFVFWKGTDNQLKQVSWTGRWSGVVSLGMGPLGSAPSVAIGKDGQRYAFWQGTDHTLKQAYWNGRSWVGPLAVGFSGVWSQPAVQVDTANRLTVFWRGSNNDLIEAARTAWP